MSAVSFIDTSVLPENMDTQNDSNQLKLQTRNQYLYENEPICSRNRIQLYPIQYNDIWEMYKQAVAAFWVPEEVSLIDDLNDWSKLDNEERHFVLMVLAFFACSDFIVNENLDEEYTEHVAIPELKMFLHYQEMMEDIHTQMYQILINTLVGDETLKQKLFNATSEVESIQKKAGWARFYIQNGDFVERLVAFSCVEGIFFSGSFCSLFWLKKRNLMKGLCHSNELIARDEGMHRDMACLVYSKYIVNKIDPERVKAIVNSAVNIEKEFIQESLPFRLKGMNKDLMSQYVEYVADHMLNQMIGETLYKVSNPFPWMDLISLEGKTNFFERRVSSYAKQSVITVKEEKEIRFDSDF